MSILVLNCGSSSLKFAFYSVENGEKITSRASGLVEGIGTDKGRFKASGDLGREEIDLDHPTHLTGFAALKQWLDRQGLVSDPIEGIGHRVVHGGSLFPKSVLVDDSVLEGIDSYSEIAPLHNPAHLLGIRESMKAWPGIPQVTVFDTAFHQTMPPRAYRYGIPEALCSEHGVRKYGAHGTSHRFVAMRAAELLESPIEELKLITAHLGNGSSISAISGGICRDTSMGLTPLEGVMMGTRSGNIDPSVFGYLERRLGWNASRTLQMLNKESGLLGVSGISQDMRTLIASREAGDERAALAIEMFVYRVAKEIGSQVVAAEGINALVFTGGIGENSAPIRAEVSALLAPLGISVDPAANSAAVRGAGGIISPAETEGATKRPIVLVIPTDEEWVIARDTLALVRHRQEVR